MAIGDSENLGKCYTWVFSGVGVVIVGGVFKFILSKFFPKIKKGLKKHTAEEPNKFTSTLFIEDSTFGVIKAHKKEEITMSLKTLS